MVFLPVVSFEDDFARVAYKNYGFVILAEQLVAFLGQSDDQVQHVHHWLPSCLNLL